MSTSEQAKLREWARVADERGWTVKISAGHLKWYRPDGTFATSTPSTPSGGSSIRNSRAKLRRAGLKGIQ